MEDSSWTRPAKEMYEMVRVCSANWCRWSTSDAPGSSSRERSDGATMEA